MRLNLVKIINFICSYVHTYVNCFRFVILCNITLMKIQILLYLSVVIIISSCSSKTENPDDKEVPHIEYTVEPAPEWTALFNRSEGWFGGDGIFTIPFSGTDASSDDSVLFLFSDTMVGEIKEGKLQPGYKMVNNSVMVLKGEEPVKEKTHFLVKETLTKEPTTLFVPNTPATTAGDYYWLGDGFVNHSNANMYILAYRIRNTNDGSAFPFREVGNDLLVVPSNSKFPFENYRQLELPFNKSDSIQISLGAAVLSNTSSDNTYSPDGFVYVYGVRGKAKELIAARVEHEAVEDFSAWKFWNGSDWSNSVHNAVAIEDSVSNELSVTPIGKNLYALVYQYGGIYPTIYMQFASTPVGPFGPRKKVWDTTKDIKDPDLFTYNAKAHPAISKPGELLVSYNVNSFKFFDVIERMPDLYRPRFVRIIFNSNK